MDTIGKGQLWGRTVFPPHELINIQKLIDADALYESSAKSLINSHNRKAYTPFYCG